MAVPSPELNMFLADAPPSVLVDMWITGELHEMLGLGEGTRVEVIEGEVFVRAPIVSAHAFCLEDIREGMLASRISDPGFSWEPIGGPGLQLDITNGYIPDLLVLDTALYEGLRTTQVPVMLAPHITLAVEVTSKSTARYDRPPTSANGRSSKWRAYARSGIPFYLLVDRSPKVAATTLYSKPEGDAYTAGTSWPFGECIVLPDPLGFAVDLAVDWLPWQGTDRP